PVDLIDRNRKPNPGERPGWTEDSRGHADQPALAVEQRTAGVSRIDWRARLNHSSNCPACHGLHFPSESADDAGGHRLVEAERVADGVRYLSHLEIVGAA